MQTISFITIALGLASASVAAVRSIHIYHLGPRERKLTISSAPSLGSCLGLQLLGDAHAPHDHHSHLHTRCVDSAALQHPSYSLPLPVWLPSAL